MEDSKIEVKQITTADLRRMEDREGIVFEGCADLQGWVDGLSDSLTEAGILLNGSRFEKVSTFQRGKLACILFDFEGVELNYGKFAMWRLQTYGQLGGIWLSDYVPNRLGGFSQKETQREKPDCELIGQDGSIFNLIGIASRTLRQAGMGDQAKEMSDRIHDEARDYSHALGIIGEYVNITGPQEPEMGWGDMA